MTTSQNGPATSPAGPSGRCEWCNMPGHYPSDCGWIRETDPFHRGLFLAELLADLAELRHAATVAYAEAFLGHVGTDAQRTQAAKLAAADAHLEAEKQAARVAGYRHMVAEGADDATS